MRFPRARKHLLTSHSSRPVVEQTVSLEDGQPTLVMCGLLSARQRSSPQGSGDQDPRKQHKLF
jgi:hypothetical protein